MVEPACGSKIEYPIRINRFFALKNVCSRREADELVARGAVFINGKKAAIGDKVVKGDTVEVEAGAQTKKQACFAYNKPEGEEISNSQKKIEDVFPVGGLDKNSRGLVIFTNNGRIASRLLDQQQQYEREYVVSTDKSITNTFLKAMSHGVQLEDVKTRPAEVKKKSDTAFRIIMFEEKKHEIRRMCANLGWTAVDISRVRIANICLGNLAAGAFREIKGKELADFLDSIGVKRHQNVFRAL